jgi:succinate-semialdehyde dehydrogenase / glutarate-semialdehyde dehydrogenase
VTHPDVGFLAFIGSTAVGEQIASAAGLKRLLLELGGNGPLIVLDDAAVDAAVVSCYYMAGQVCTSAERILVHSAVHDEFVQKLTARAAALTVGDPLDESTELGPVSEKRMLAKIVAHIDDARDKGATITTGGGTSGQFHEAAVLTGVTRDMRIYQEETFGPVAPIVKIGSGAQALTLANDTDYGLSMALFTSSLTTAYEMSEGLQAGAVAINAGTNDWELGGPFGGYKKSGIGRELGDDALRAFTNVKTVSFTLL